MIYIDQASVPAVDAYEQTVERVQYRGYGHGTVIDVVLPTWLVSMQSSEDAGLPDAMPEGATLKWFLNNGWSIMHVDER